MGTVKFILGIIGIILIIVSVLALCFVETDAFYMMLLIGIGLALGGFVFPLLSNENVDKCIRNIIIGNKQR